MKPLHSLLALPLALVMVSAVPAAAQHQQQRRTPEPEKAIEKVPDCAAAMGALPKDWTGEAYAQSGDTLAGVGLKPRLRLWGIQTPELRDREKSETVPGMRARAALEDLLAKSDHKVSCRVAKWDRECSLVAQCAVGAPPMAGDVGGFMLASGLAYGFHLDETLPWEARASQRYAAAEAQAREKRLGLWKDWLGEK